MPVYLLLVLSALADTTDTPTERVTGPSGSIWFLPYALGDVNGDTFPDLLVGDTLSSGGTGDAWLYLGTGSGFDDTPALHIAGEGNPEARWAESVAIGDFDGDGYDDLALNDFRWGFVDIHFGSAAGPTETPDLRLEIGEWYLGTQMCAFDADGDGDDELAASDEFNWSVWVWEGTEDGPSTTPRQLVEDDDMFGMPYAAGDLDADGDEELLVFSSSRLRLYYGAPDGIPDSADVQMTSTGTNYDMAAPGDIDGDGFGDLVVGAHLLNDAWVFYGSATGIPTAPDVVHAPTGTDSDAEFGTGVAIADTNRDGYGDVAIGAPLQGAYDDGFFSLYHGSADGLDTTPDSRAEGSPNLKLGRLLWGMDTDGDGHEDVVSGVVNEIAVYGGFLDVDRDGFGSAGADTSDCDDANPEIHPEADEILDDGVDQDCDGRELCRADADGDTHGAEDGSTVSSDDLDCDDAGEAGAAENDDCDDTSADRFPGNAEIPEDGVDQDCDGVDSQLPDDEDTDVTDDTDVPDDTDAPDDVEEKGCGCATSGSPWSYAWIAAALVLARRRR